MNISNFLTPKMYVVTLSGDMSVSEALERMRESGYTALPVLSADDRYLKTVNEGDLLWKIYDLAEKGATKADFLRYRRTKLKDIPIRKVNPPVRIMTNVETLIGTVMNQNFVPVVDDRDYFVGIVTRRHVIGRIAEMAQQSASA